MGAKKGGKEKKQTTVGQTTAGQTTAGQTTDEPETEQQRPKRQIVAKKKACHNRNYLKYSLMSTRVFDNNIDV